MTRVNIYLTFNGNCEEAFEFSRSAFGGEFSHVGRFNEMPQDDGGFQLSDEEANRIMHISLPISKETILMGSDTGGGWGTSFQKGNNFSVSINTDSRIKADDYFACLSNGGKVNMPMQETFWGDYFGMFTDKFGINWMISYNENAFD